MQFGRAVSRRGWGVYTFTETGKALTVGSNARNSLGGTNFSLKLGRRPNNTLAGLQAIINSSPRQRTSSPSGSAVRTAFKESSYLKIRK